jgi:ion channel-forming bestrophin family protein
VNTTRNLARQIWVFVGEESLCDRQEKVATLRLLVAFVVATKLHLREHPPNAELAALLSKDQFLELQTSQNPPLRIAIWIEDYLQKQYQTGRIYIYQLTALNHFVSKLVDSLGACERILKTPMPMAYAIHLMQLLLIYCLLLPFQLVKDLGFWTGPVVALISFTLFGIEEIGIEIENPFGHDLNDLPLDSICNTILNNIEDLIRTNPKACLANDRKTQMEINESSLSLEMT